MSNSPDPFTPDEVVLLEKVIALVPDLKIVAHAAKAGRSRLSYPVNSFEDLHPFFEGDKETFVVGNWKTSKSIAEKYFPAVFFPITSEDDFISKVYLALAIGTTSHSPGRHHIPTIAVLKEIGAPLDKIRETQPELFEDAE